MNLVNQMLWTQWNCTDLDKATLIYELLFLLPQRQTRMKNKLLLSGRTKVEKKEKIKGNVS